MSPEESSRRLGLIFDKIDKDKDTFVTLEELRDWIKYTQQRYLRDDIEKQWKYHNPDEKEKITWLEYSNMIYGFMDEKDAQSVEQQNEAYSYATMKKRDRRRWSIADVDGDDSLTKDEFQAFLHPEETDYMKDIVVIETIEDIDKDKDGKISLEEYIGKFFFRKKKKNYYNIYIDFFVTGDMYKKEDGEEVPEWVRNEQEQFSSYRDKNGDGFMDNEEVKLILILRNTC